MNDYFINANFKPPELLGQAADMNIIVDAGTRYVQIGNELKEVCCYAEHKHAKLS